MFKVGDKIYCKKNFEYLDVVRLHEGTTYTIHTYQILPVGSVIGSGAFRVIVLNEKGIFHRFSVNPGGGSLGYPYLWMFFCNKQEHRKLKLEKLNNI